MVKKITVVLLMLIMVPAFALAGTYSIAVTSGSVSGSVGPAPLSGFTTAVKIFTATAATNYTLSSVTRNGVNVTSNTTYVNGTGPWTVTVPLSNTSQTFYVNFKQIVQATPTLTAILPSGITIPVNSPTLLSGANSTIANLQAGTQATFTFSGAGLTFGPASGQVTTPANITTNISAVNAGTFTATLTLTAPGATPSSANVQITVQPPGITASAFALIAITVGMKPINTPSPVMPPVLKALPASPATTQGWPSSIPAIRPPTQPLIPVFSTPV